MTWKDGEEQMLDELSGQLQEYEEGVSSSLHIRVSAVNKVLEWHQEKKVSFTSLV